MAASHIFIAALIKDPMTDVNLIIRAKMLIDGLGGAPVSQGLVTIAGDRIVYAGSAALAPEFSLPPHRASNCRRHVCCRG